MNREVHVRFWESAGLRCPAPLTYFASPLTSEGLFGGACRPKYSIAESAEQGRGLVRSDAGCGDIGVDMILRTVARDTDSVRTISLIGRRCSKYARRTLPIRSTDTISQYPSRPLRTMRKDADTAIRGVGFEREIRPQGVSIASEFKINQRFLGGLQRRDTYNPEKAASFFATY
jgi:hypothetical protein